jgi:MoxR-like ATPase
MKAIDNFLVEATKQYGENAVITIDQAKQVLKDIKRAIGIGHIKQAGMVSGMGEFAQVKLKSVNAAKTDVAVVTKKEVVKEVVKETSQDNSTVNLIMGSDIQNLVPSAFDGFVAWGHHSTIKQVVKSKMFYPVFVTGLSGNGKTLMIEQVHAELKKELIRVNITIETDEDDLLGGFRLVNGETKYVPGPVIEAMQRGCTLLLDECDLGSNKLMCLQPVLEGKGVYLKKVNKWITPKDGFNVMATANTKGKGSEDGRFIGTNILNEAFLERFAVTIEQPYASNSVEKKIVLGSMKKYGAVDEKFATNLVQWSEVIRKTFYDGGIDEVISTRRLDHIVKAFAIFKDKMKSIELCVSRFDTDTKESFLDLYSKIDAGVDPLAEEKKEEEVTKEIVDDENDF